MSFWKWFSWDIGPGVGMSGHRLPSLEILISGMQTDFLAAVANVLSNDYVRGVHSSPSCCPHLLFVELWVWPFWGEIWPLAVTLIGTYPVIFMDIEHFVLRPFGDFYSFFLYLKGCIENLPCNWPLQSQLCLQLISAIITPCRFLRATVIDSPAGLVTWRRRKRRC